MAVVDVVILTWNDGPLLAAALESALASTAIDLRVIVFDNGSTPPAVVTDHPQVTLIRNEVNLGVAAGRNRGAAEGSSPFICFLDSDARLLPDSLSRLLEPFAVGPEIAMTAPVFTGQAPEASAGIAPTLVDKARRVLNLRQDYRPTAHRGASWDVDFAIGACQVVRREDFARAGGFDASYFYGPEDVDLCLRLRESGASRCPGGDHRLHPSPPAPEPAPVDSAWPPARLGRGSPPVAPPPVPPGRFARAGGAGGTMIDTVIVAFASEAVIADAVRSAQALGGRVVVIDHGGGESARRAAALGATTVHDPYNPGFGSGQNRGFKATSSEFVLLCNPDAEVDADAVTAGRSYLESHPRVAAVQGVVVNQATMQPERSQGVAVRPVHLLGRAFGARRLLRLRVVRRVAARTTVLRDHAQRTPPRPEAVESLAATALLIRRAAFEAVEGFDASYFLYGEDLDLCRRLRQAGWQLVALPQVWATHESGGSASSNFTRELNWWAGTMRYACLWFTPAQWVAATASATVMATRLSLRSPALSRLAWGSLIVTPVRTRRTRSLAS